MRGKDGRKTGKKGKLLMKMSLWNACMADEEEKKE